MIKVTEQEWKEIPAKQKRKTPLTKLKQYLYKNPEGKADEWITETINFVITDKGGCDV